MRYDPMRSLQLLRIGVGNPRAVFRDGQQDAIRHIVEGRGRLLVVQKTGWGKSFVYFIATKQLREAGAGPALLTAVFTAVAIVLSETTSNTASANMVVPVAIAVSAASNVDPVLPALGATLGASMGFMMPISTAPNAIVYSSGHVPIGAMMRYGIVLDVAAFIAIVGLLVTVGPLLF